MDTTKLTISDLENIQEICLRKIKNDELYEVRNLAKIRAVNSVKSYEEFKGIVDAAHLKPLSKEDKNNVPAKNQLWNKLS